MQSLVGHFKRPGASVRSYTCVVQWGHMQISRGQDWTTELMRFSSWGVLVKYWESQNNFGYTYCTVANWPIPVLLRLCLFQHRAIWNEASKAQSGRSLKVSWLNLNGWNSSVETMRRGFRISLQRVEQHQVPHLFLWSQTKLCSSCLISFGTMWIHYRPILSVLRRSMTSQEPWQPVVYMIP